MTDSDRLDRIEAALERTQQQVESNARSIQALSADIAANRADIAATRASVDADIAATRASVDGLVQTIAEFSARSEARLMRLDDAITGINATNERLERIVDYLMRRDREGNGDR